MSRAGAERDLFGKTPPGRADWSHRRREPRALALFWLVYLIASSVPVVWTAMQSPTLAPSALRPAGRGLAAAVLLGLTLLWPMLRLSQASAEQGAEPEGPTPGPLACVARDLLVLLPPACAVLVVQPLLVGWSLRVTAALCVLLCVWGVLIGAVLGLCEAQARRGVPGVLAAGAALLVLLIGGTLLLPAVRGGVDEREADWAAMLGPVSGAIELTRPRPRTGTPVAVLPAHGAMLAGIGLAGVGLWLGAVASGATGVRDRGQGVVGGATEP